MIVRIAQGHLQTKYGTLLEILYYDGQKESIALVMGHVEGENAVLCRVHSACISAHVFNSIECDCREQMEMAQELIQNEGKGIIIWLDQEGRDNGHFALLQSAPLRAQGMSQTEAYAALGFEIEGRDYRRAAEILADLKVESINLITNNPHKIKHLVDNGVKIARNTQVFIRGEVNETLKKTYLDKISRGHIIPLEEN